MSAKQPIAILHVDRPIPNWWYLPDTPIPGMTVEQIVAACREHSVRFYIERVDTNHGDGRND